MIKKFIIFIILISFPTNLYCGEIPWKKDYFNHVANEEQLKDFLSYLSKTQGFIPVISEKVKGVVNGKFSNILPKDMFGNITVAFNLIYFFFNNILYIYNSEEIEEKVINLKYITRDTFLTSLKEINIIDDLFPIKAISKENIIIISGPKQYVEIITQLSESLDQPIKDSNFDLTIKVFPLKYASADDTANAENNVVIPGVVTILQSILGNKSPSANKNINAVSRNISKSLTGSGLNKKEQETKKTTDSSLEEINVNQMSIQANTRLNAVIIKDKKDKMIFYEELIKQLDVPSGVIQINASIIDIKTSASKEMGVNWRYSNRSNNFKVDSGFYPSEKGVIYDDASTNKFDSSKYPSLLTNGFNLSAVLGNSGTYFLSQIRFLEGKNDAKIISCPTVLTLNNTQAQIEQSSTFYIKVGGYQQTDLYNVNASTLLLVTPHIIKDEDKYKIRLFVKIEDGTVDDSKSIEGIPYVHKSSINTQAVIDENESLLIGGYYNKKNNNDVVHVPFLAQIPIIGRLFKYQSNSNEQYERLFMITPKILSYGFLQDGNLTITSKETKKNDQKFILAEPILSK
ncbi:MAG: type III secretion system outer membrane ring subunit SctC [Desulfobacterales bacterium]|nr:type III secretion system outer membrane ring subunit SctC [Desulfobacterales bacterium]